MGVAVPMGEDCVRVAALDIPPDKINQLRVDLHIVIARGPEIDRVTNGLRRCLGFFPSLGGVPMDNAVSDVVGIGDHEGGNFRAFAQKPGRRAATCNFDVVRMGANNQYTAPKYAVHGYLLILNCPGLDQILWRKKFLEDTSGDIVYQTCFPAAFKAKGFRLL